MRYSKVQNIDINNTSLNSESTVSKRSRLTAEWLIIDNKLVCKWNITHEQ